MWLLCLLLCLLSLLLLAKIATPSFSKINNITINVYFYYVVLTLVGAFVIAGSNVQYDIASYYIKNDAKIYSLIVIAINFLLYCSVIFLLMSFFRNANGHVFNDFCQQEFTLACNEKVIFRVFFIFFIISASGLAYLFLSGHQNPLFLLLGGSNVEEVYSARIKAFDYGFFYFAIRKISYELSILSALYFCLMKGWLIKSLAFLNCAVQGLLLTEKAPFIYFILALMFLFTLRNNNKIGFLKILIVLLALVSLLSLSLLFLYNQSDFIGSLKNVFNRVFIQQISGVFLSIQHYGTVTDFDLGFNLFPKIYGLLGFPDSKIIAEQLAEFYLSSLYVMGDVKNINGLYIMDSWAAGGILGSLIVTFILACYAVFTYLFFLRKRKEPLVLVFYTYYSVYNLSFISSGGMSLFSPFAVFFLLVFIILYKRNDRISKVDTK